MQCRGSLPGSGRSRPPPEISAGAQTPGLAPLRRSPSRPLAGRLSPAHPKGGRPSVRLANPGGPTCLSVCGSHTMSLTLHFGARGRSVSGGVPDALGTAGDTARSPLRGRNWGARSGARGGTARGPSLPSFLQHVPGAGLPHLRSFWVQGGDGPGDRSHGRELGAPAWTAGTSNRPQWGQPEGGPGCPLKPPGDLGRNGKKSLSLSCLRL